MKVEMTFKDNKYSVISEGKTIETGTYTIVDGKLMVKTEADMNMNATVTADKLIFDTPDFITTLMPK